MDIPRTVGPADVHEPVARALGMLIVVAAASFVLSVAAVLATVFATEGHVHGFAHLSLPGLMGLVLVVRATQYVRGRPRSTEDPWARAGALSSFDTRLAQLLSIAVPTAWLFGSAAILVRHGAAFQELAPGIGLLLPLGAAFWICATFAWIDACRDLIATAIDEADRRFRAYWREVGRTS